MRVFWKAERKPLILMTAVFMACFYRPASINVPVIVLTAKKKSRKFCNPFNNVIRETTC